MIAYVVVGVDTERGTRMKAFVGTWCTQMAEAVFRERFPPPRYLIEESREAFLIELDARAGESDMTVMDVVALAGDDCLAWSTDIDQ